MDGQLLFKEYLASDCTILNDNDEFRNHKGIMNGIAGSFLRSFHVFRCNFISSSTCSHRSLDGRNVTHRQHSHVKQSTSPTTMSLMAVSRSVMIACNVKSR